MIILKSNNHMHYFKGFHAKDTLIRKHKRIWFHFTAQRISLYRNQYFYWTVEPFSELHLTTDPFMLHFQLCTIIFVKLFLLSCFLTMFCTFRVLTNTRCYFTQSDIWFIDDLQNYCNTVNVLYKYDDMHVS